MLIAVSVLPIALQRVREVQGDADPIIGPVVAGVTLAVTTVLALRAPKSLKPWSPLLALFAGSVVAAFVGAYDTQPVIDAAWAGIPTGGFPGLDLTHGPDFWALLPAFVVVTLVGGVKNMGDSVAVQQASRRKPKVTDFRLVQGALNTNGPRHPAVGIRRDAAHNGVLVPKRHADHGSHRWPPAGSAT